VLHELIDQVWSITNRINSFMWEIVV